MPRPAAIRIGTSGWSVDKAVAPGSRPELSSLERYAEHFDAVEINSTFYRLPRAATLERWRDSTPARFRFAVKVPQAITHEAGLVGASAQLREFCELMGYLRPKLGPLLVQLPPSLELDGRRAATFLRKLSSLHAGSVAVEPRHESWFSERAERLLVKHGAARVAADPARCPPAAEPAGARELVYYRWHGSPRMYFSSYEDAELASLAHSLNRAARDPRTKEVYCFFDNTALGAAAINALSLQALLEPLTPAPGPKQQR